MTGSIDWLGWAIWGFGATVVLTVILAAGQGLGLTRMSIPYLLGSMATADRDRARLYGIALHFGFGWAFSFIYVLTFHVWGGPTWWKGALIGVAHGAFVLGVLMPAMPAIHPRMASASRGPTVVRQLEPPGFLGLHYGTRTPVMSLVAHVVFGAILGTGYLLA